MAQKTYLDYEGLQEVLRKINEKYAPISALVFKGTVADIAHLPALADQKSGYMYNVTTGGETTADFVEGAGHILRDGNNVAAVNVGTDEDPEFKWDILPGVFKIEDRLQFGFEMPADPEDEQVFLYLGDTTYTYPAVSPAPTPDGDPSTIGLYEKDALLDKYIESADDHLVAGKTYFTISADATPPTSNPADEGYYELGITDGKYTYTKTTDTSVDSSKTYHLIIIAPTPVNRGDDPQALGYYVEDAGTPGTYVATTDTYVKPGVTYHTKEEQYLEGVIYQYDEATSVWNPKTAGDTFVRITEAQIDAMFDEL